LMTAMHTQSAAGINATSEGGVEGRMTDPKPTDYFGSKADEWVTLYQAKVQFRDRLELFVNGVRRYVSRPGKVLDFGCGPGIMSMALACEGYEVTGLDGAERMIDVARRQSLQRGLRNVCFQVMDSESFSPVPESYDAVICSSVLEYVEDDQKLLGRLAEALRPGGLLLVSVPHSASYLGRMEDAIAALRVPGLKRGPGRMDLKYSKRRYRVDDFLLELGRQSFEILSTTFFEVPLLGRWGIWLSRSPRVGMMLLVAAAKAEPTEPLKRRIQADETGLIVKESL
jgi:SAM-dependent methyltransferase